ncbi:hypothetical protein CTAYLR_006181 [Chrysophaeum taylorii]|uniref:Replication protein A C-terminal domain-containing protein n=1 Tax=Chrysophaeum taylorii TaxID=2483200 RepID=A0AAD7UPW1_9STRA|nr:hypothetical protein CTAYLR_006181 [Chrysophaeum taylorii]
MRPTSPRRRKDDSDTIASLAPIQKKVLEHYSLHWHSRIDEDLHIKSVVEYLARSDMIAPADVEAAVDALTADGLIYSTFDDN